MVRLGEIFQDIMAAIFSPKAQSDRSSVLNNVDKFNLRLSQWHSQLPDHLQWSQWSLTKDHIGHHIFILQ